MANHILRLVLLALLTHFYLIGSAKAQFGAAQQNSTSPSPQNCAALANPGSHEARVAVLELAVSIGIPTERLQSVRLCENNDMYSLLFANMDEDSIFLEFNQSLYVELDRVRRQSETRLDISYIFQMLMALNRLALFEPGIELDLLNVIASRRTGEQLARTRYSPPEFEELEDLLRADARANSPAEEARVDVLANAYRREYARIHPPQRAPERQEELPAAGHPANSTPSHWASGLALLERWFGWIGSIGGGVAVLYGLWRWIRSGRRKSN